MLSTNRKQSTPLRVGFLSRWDMNDPNAMSGTVHHCAKALKNAGIELVDISNLAEINQTAWNKPINLEPVENNLAPQIYSNAKNFWRRIKKSLSKCTLLWDEQRELRFAKKIGARAKQRLIKNNQNLDAVFGVCSSAEIANLDVNVPIIYASDTTAQLYHESYQKYESLSSGCQNAQNKFETQALDKCEYFLPASECGLKSALLDYKVPPERIKLIEFGAHITPNQRVAPKKAPTKKNLQLCMVASDPVRKQLPLCISVAEELQQRGWRVQLNYIGEYHPAIAESKLVNWSGKLKLGSAKDSERHRQILRDSHWMLLPSKAEAYGIAACEAAHFGVPCAVSDIGGLPTVVKHNVTGLVLPIAANARDYADALENVLLDGKQYTKMSRASIERATRTLSWDRWAQRVVNVVKECVAVEKQAYDVEAAE